MIMDRSPFLPWLQEGQDLLQNPMLYRSDVLLMLVSPIIAGNLPPTLLTELRLLS